MRVFVGSFVSPSTQDLLDRFVAGLVEPHRHVLRAIPPKTSHFTHAFLGEVDASEVGAILASIGDALTQVRAFGIQIRDPHVLLGGSRPRLVCADVVRGREALQQLSSDLCQVLQRTFPAITLSPGKAPHVTLARFRKQAKRPDGRRVSSWLQTHGAALDANSRVEAVQVVASVLTEAGPQYEVIGQATLN